MSGVRILTSEAWNLVPEVWSQRIIVWRLDSGVYVLDSRV